MRLAILGAGGHGKVVADIAELNGWEAISFYDDGWPQKENNEHWAVIGSSKDLYNHYSSYDGVFIAIGNNSTRCEFFRSFYDVGAPIVSLIHPFSSISRYATVEPGTLVVAGAVVNAHASVGAASILNTNCSIGHDCILAEGVHVCPGARLAGGVIVGHRTWVGVGCSIRELISIGSDVVVGAGAAVVKDIADNMYALGVPARNYNPTS